MTFQGTTGWVVLPRVRTVVSYAVLPVQYCGLKKETREFASLMRDANFQLLELVA